MKPSTRIIVNTLATYGRSVIGMALSLFSARWVLMALGETDFGLYGVVGSVILLITFLNGGMSAGVVRFYAYSIGWGHHQHPDVATEDMKRWFNTAVALHLVVPLLLIPIGYPIGVYAIKHWLTVPPDRIAACIWVFRVSLVTAFVNMVSVPFVSMYRAHQYITELAVFELLGTVGSFAGAYLLLRASGDKLVVYAIYMMVVAAGIPLLQIVRAVMRFDACRLKTAYLFHREYLKKFFAYVGWKMFGMTCVAVRLQGSPVLVNLYFGPQVNAAYSIANRLSIQATTLSMAMMGAFAPAITTMEGRGERQKMLDTALQVCKFSTLLVLFFVTPLMLEMDTVLKLWLKNPPEHTGVLCQWMLAMLVIDRMTAGHMQAVNALGKIAMYELVQGLTLFLALPLMWLLFRMGVGPVSLGYALLLTMLIYCAGRLAFCKSLLGLPIFSWVRSVAVPVTALILGAVSAGSLVMFLCSAGFVRVCITAMVCGVVSLGLGWFYLLNKNERAYLGSMLRKMASRFAPFYR